MSKKLPSNLSTRGYEKVKTNIFELEPLKTEVTVIGYLFRIVITGFLATFALFFLIITLSMLFSPQLNKHQPLTQRQVESKVLGATTSNNSFVGNILKTVLRPLGYASLWLVKLPGEGKTIIDPLTITSINDIFEYDSTRNKVVVKKELIFEDKSAIGSSVTQWEDIQDVPPLLSKLNGVAGDENTNINLVEGNNITISENKSKNSLTISSTGGATVISNSGGSGDISLTAGTGISVSGTFPDFSISNTDRGSSQKIFKNVKVTGQPTLVADNNSDSLTFAAGAGIALTTSAGSDTITIASTGGAVSFDAVTTGTNTNALLIGTGGSLGVTGTGTITATTLVASSSVVSDAEVDNNLTIDGSGSINADAVNSGTLGAAGVTLALGSFGSITGSLGDANVDDAITVAAAGITGSLTDTQVSDTLTASNLVAAGSVVSDPEVDDNITVDWSGLQNYPLPCAANNAITALGDSPTCAVFWNAGNDGAGSTLDADLLDGLSSADFSPVAGSGSITTVGALTSGSIAAGFGTISTSNSISGTILTATTAASGLVLGSGLNATTFSSTATSARALSFPDEDGIICTTGSVCTGYQTSGTYVTSVSGTADRITSSGGTTPVIDIAATYVGQASITTTGALNSGSITSGFGSIDVGAGNDITGATLNGTTGINTGADAGTQRIDASGNLVNIGSITSNGAYSYSLFSTTTTGDVFTLSATQLRTSGSVISASGVASPDNNTISIFKFVPYGINAVAQGSDLINGVLIDWQQGNIFDTAATAENILNINVVAQGDSKTDATISTGLLINNADTSAGNQIVITDALKFSSAAGDTSAFTNYINSTNFVVTSAGAITANGSLDINSRASIGNNASPSTLYALSIREDSSSNTAIRRQLNITSSFRSSAADASFYGIYLQNQSQTNTANFTAVQYGIYSEAFLLGSSVTGPSAYTYSDVRNFDSILNNTIYPPLVTDFYNYRTSNPSITDTDGEITNFYGFYVEDITEGDITNKYGFYQAGTNATNYFGGETRFDSDVAFGAQDTLAVNDTTPDVSASSSFITANTAWTLISDFDAGAGTLQAGHVIFVEVNDANTDFDCTASGLNCGSTDITTTAAGDFFTWYYDGTDWHLVSFMDDSDNHNAGSGFDLAELFPSTQNLEPGDIVSIDPQASHPGYVVKSSKASDPGLIGIVSTNPGITLGEPADLSAYPIALAGRVPTKVSTENGPIEPGDPLTSSSTPGVAMKATESGPIIGKALESFDGAQVGKVMVFVSTGWYVAPLKSNIQNPASSLTNIDVQTLTAKSIDTQVLFIGGKKLSVNSDGWLVAEADMEIKGDLKVAGEVTAKKLNVSDEAAGTVTLKSGEKKVFVPTTLITDKSQVLLTPNTLTGSNFAVTKKEPGKGFVVEISAPETKSVDFDWFIVN